MDDQRRARRRRRRRPRPGRDHDLRRRARLRRRRPRPHARPVPLVRRDGRQPRRRHRRALRRARRAVPEALTDYIKGRQGYDYNEHGQAGNTHTEFVPDEIVDRFCILGPVDEHLAPPRRAARPRRRPVRHLPPARRQGPHARRPTASTSSRRLAEHGAAPSADRCTDDAAARCGAQVAVRPGSCWSPRLWELYKAVGPEDGGTRARVRRSCRGPTTSPMPHVWDMRPAPVRRRRAGTSDTPIWRVVLAGGVVLVPPRRRRLRRSASPSASALAA